MDDDKTQKRYILEFVKGLTNDLIQGTDLQEPDKLVDKVYHAAFLNLRNCLAGIIDESKTLKRRHKDLHAKVEDLTRTANNLQENYCHSNETVEKLRDEIDLKESNERVLQHQLKQYKESYKEKDVKHASNLKEYDDIANEMKSQIELLEQKNKKLSETVALLQNKLKHERHVIEGEKEALYQTQLICSKNMKVYQKKKSEMKLKKYDLERDKEMLLNENEAVHLKNKKVIENKFSELLRDRASFDQEKLDFERHKSDFQQKVANFQRQKSNFNREKSDLGLDKSDVEREKEVLQEALSTYQIERKDLEQSQISLEYEKVELSKAFTQLNLERNELEMAKVKLTEGFSSKGSLGEFKEKLIQLSKDVNQEKRLKEEVDFQERITNQLLESLTKVEKLQDKLEERTKNRETLRSESLQGFPGEPPVTSTHSHNTSNTNSKTYCPVSESMPVISTIPLSGYPCVSQHRPNNKPNSNKTIHELLPKSPKDTTNVFKFEPALRDNHLSRGEEDMPREMNQTNMNVDVLGPHDTMQRKLKNFAGSSNDIKWDLCRLEAKIGDAVLKRSLYNNTRM